MFLNDKSSLFKSLLPSLFIILINRLGYLFKKCSCQKTFVCWISKLLTNTSDWQPPNLTPVMTVNLLLDLASNRTALNDGKAECVFVILSNSHIRSWSTLTRSSTTLLQTCRASPPGLRRCGRFRQWSPTVWPPSSTWSTGGRWRKLTLTMIFFSRE